ncbi:MAG: hypothetical protein ABWY63_00795 [Hyphomicrobiaceae bacterium]|jgi:hypothetical protein
MAFLTVLLQLAAGLLLAPAIVSRLPLSRVYHIVYALVLGGLVWLAGLLVAHLMKGPAPRTATLVASIIGALIGVSVVLLPTFVPATGSAIRLLSEPLYLVAGALAGYWLVR